MKSKKFLKFRRKREGKTDYKKRLTLISSGKLRLVVRRSLKNISCQVVEYHENGDKVLVNATSHDLKKLGWKHYTRNLPSAYLVGYLCGKKATESGIKEAILDSGLYKNRQGTIIYACLKGFVDSGINVPHDPKIFPSEERINGQHISEELRKDVESLKGKVGK